MTVEKKPFQRYTDDAEFVRQDIISVKLSKEERDWLEALKRYHQTEYDGTALKNEAFKTFKQMKELAEIQRKK